MPVDSGPPIAHALLDWYDVHARRLPWRARSGERAEPYRVWLSEIMLQQTTVAAVKPYFQTFTTCWPTVEALAAAPDAEVMAAWAGLGYYARARNLLACARKVVAAGGLFPSDEEGLRRLPGVGRYTAAAIAAIAFGRAAVVIDGNVERVVARLFAIKTPLPAARCEIEQFAARISPVDRVGDYAQAMMDLGATICVPRAPACAICPLREHCAGHAAGAPEKLPAKAARPAKPTRQGTIFWLEERGRVLLIRRPDKGLLGGMRALPTGPWTEDAPELTGAPDVVAWTERGKGRHVFTHFTLEYRVVAAAPQTPDAGEWWPIERLADAGLPTLFRSAAAIALTDKKEAA